MTTFQKIRQHLAKAATNRVEIDDRTFFRNTQRFSDAQDKNMEWGDDVQFVHKDIELRCFSLDIVNANDKHHGFAYCDFIYDPENDLPRIAEAFCKLDEVIGRTDPEVVNIEDL